MDEQTLEDKTGFFGRMKYAAIPAALTVGAYFMPEIKARYNSLNEDKKMKCQNTILWGVEIAGTVAAVVSGAKLYRNYKAGNSRGKEN
ncbi:MAG TPA: hypothetical protein VEC16_02475 [Alphaproteobacteria bacterium]|nr:hypothetical protein [Alphaproteobacteria bacterium]